MHIIIDSFIAHIPASVLRWTLQLPSDAFTVIRTTRALAAQLGTRLVDEKVESSRRGLERSDDVYSALCRHFFLLSSVNE
jgi:hypothetical protein